MSGDIFTEDAEWAAARATLDDGGAVVYAAAARARIEAARARLESLDLNARTVEAELVRRSKAT